VSHLTIIIPAHNEEARIGPTLAEYCQAFPDADILIVLNGCTDGTEDVARLYARRHANIKILTIRAAVGKGGAVRAGLAFVETPLVGFVDADLSFPVSEFRRLVEALQDADAAIASRWLPGARALAPVPRMRRFSSIAFNTVVRSLFWLPFRDTQCGAKAFRTSVLRAIAADLEVADFAFDVDVLHQLHRRGASIVEVPVVWRDAVGSKVRLVRSSLLMLMSVLRLRVRRSFLHVLVPFIDTLVPTQPMRVRERLRILVLNWRDIGNPAAGGAEIYMHEVSKRWVTWGHEVQWLTAGFPGAPRREVIDGVHIRRVGSRLTLYLLAPLVYVKEFRNRFDVIIESENTLPFFSPLFSMKPKVCVMYQVSRAVLSHELPRPLVWLCGFMEEVLMRFVYRHVPFVTISQSTADDMRRVGLGGDRVTIVPVGVDGALQPGQKASQPTILYLGRLKRFKRVDALIRAMPEIRKHLPAALLIIAGAGDDEERLRALSASLNLDTAVRFEGKVSERRKLELLQSAWVLVLPSAAEGWGMVALEANACGTPAIGYDVRGVREVIVNGHTGILLREGELIAPAIMRLLTDGGLRERLGSAALTRAREFSWDTCARGLLNVAEAATATMPHLFIDRFGSQSKDSSCKLRQGGVFSEGCITESLRVQSH
jgi:glycosyltransferase involved in cell wall biosynthesis